jgi:beta-galactosidase/beta-glucuronidase
MAAPSQDASFGDGWWYEGGGLYRHMRLVRASTLHAVPDRVWAYANSIGDITPHTAGKPTDGLYATSAELTFSGVLRNVASGDIADQVALTVLAVTDQNGKVLPGATGSGVAPQGLPGDDEVELGFTIKLGKNVELWSVARPFLYTAQLQVQVGKANVTDAINITVGVRTVRFSSASGLSLNGEAVKIRGFCDHSNFGAVGAAVPDRVNLFRIQALRAVGANAWRMAHNPPALTRLDFMVRGGA